MHHISNQRHYFSTCKENFCSTFLPQTKVHYDMSLWVQQFFLCTFFFFYKIAVFDALRCFTFIFKVHYHSFMTFLRVKLLEFSTWMFLCNTLQGGLWYRQSVIFALQLCVRVCVCVHWVTPLFRFSEHQQDAFWGQRKARNENNSITDSFHIHEGNDKCKQKLFGQKRSHSSLPFCIKWNLLLVWSCLSHVVKTSGIQIQAWN